MAQQQINGRAWQLMVPAVVAPPVIFSVIGPGELEQLRRDLVAAKQSGFVALPATVEIRPAVDVPLIVGDTP